MHGDAAFAELRQVLEALPVRDGAQAFARVATELLRRHGDRFRPATAPEPLAPAELRALRSVGIAPVPARPDPAPWMTATSNHAALVATSLPLADAARRLGVSEGRLRQRIAEGSLLSVRAPTGRAHRIPVFQLTDQGELPGLRGILKAMRRDLHPLQVAAFFTTPQVDLEDADGEPTTPTAWLLGGHDPAVVEDLARSV